MALRSYYDDLNIVRDTVCPTSDRKQTSDVFFTFVLCILILSEFFYLPTDAQESCFKKNIKIYIKPAPTCFVLITIIRERIIRDC